MTRHKREQQMSQYLKDLLERTVFTMLEAAAALVAVQLSSDAVPDEAWWAVPLAGLAAVIKGFAAKKVGSSESASTVPSV